MSQRSQHGQLRRQTSWSEHCRGGCKYRVSGSRQYVALSSGTRSIDGQECRIGYGAAAALADVGAKVTIISSSRSKIDAALRRLNSSDAKGVVADVRDEEGFTKTLQSLAPIDHLVFSAVDNIIRGKLEDLSLDDAKHLFGVKFWGAVIAGKGKRAKWCEAWMQVLRVNC